jgi:RND family efflux transporter MFP subunit
MLDATLTPQAPAGGPKGPRLNSIVLFAGAAFVAILVGGVTSRLSVHQQLVATTAEAAIPTVSVVRPTGAQPGALVLPGQLQAWSESPVYARTNGYLRHWFVDIGDHVKNGQVMADIDTPELDQQLTAAKAAVKTADANRALADITAKRWDRLITTHAVSQQEVDQYHGQLAARQAMEAEAVAEVDRLKALTGFERIIAPFDGVVTSRATDIGDLIVAGAATSRPLFTVADTKTLRLYVSVPQSYAAAIQPGMTAQFIVPDLPNQTFSAKLVRTADAVNGQSGTMLIQLLYDNTSGLLKPGAYAQVRLTVPVSAAGQAADLRIPSSALLFRKEGTAVAVVGADGRVTIRPIRIAQDFGAQLAVGSGVGPGDMVVDSPSDAIATGDRVKPVLANGGSHAAS